MYSATKDFIVTGETWVMREDNTICAPRQHGERYAEFTAAVAAMPYIYPSYYIMHVRIL